MTSSVDVERRFVDDDNRKSSRSEEEDDSRIATNTRKLSRSGDDAASYAAALNTHEYFALLPSSAGRHSPTSIVLVAVVAEVEQTESE